MVVVSGTYDKHSTLPRGSRTKYELVWGKICRKNGDSNFIDSGITVPWSDLNDLRVVTITQTLLHDVKGGKILPDMARARHGIMLDTMSEVLSAHSMSTKDWKENVLIVATNTDDYSSDVGVIDYYEIIDYYEKSAKSVGNMANSYTLPVWTELSVTSSYWVNKSVYPGKVKNEILQMMLETSGKNEATEIISNLWRIKSENSKV